MSFVKIEWSGYWDFPVGTYSGGTKDGDPLSGEFSPKLIDLKSLSSIDYEIEPGKPTFPRSPSWSFTLKNRDKDTGDVIYSFVEFASLGRIAEYGGHNNEFGDLFLRVTIPLLNDRVVFKGAIRDVHFTQFDNEISVDCIDFIGNLAEYEEPMFNNYIEKDMRISFGDPSELQGDIVEDFTGVNVTLKDDTELGSEDDVTLQRVELQTTTKIFYNQPDPEAWATPYETNEDLEAHIKEIIGNATFNKERSLFRRIFSDNYDWIELDKTFNVFDDGTTYTLVANFSTPARITFLQIGKDTILNQCRFRMVFQNSKSTAPGSVIGNTSSVRFFIETIQMKNGNPVVKSEKEDILVYERGRYLKQESNPESAEYEEGDYVEVVVHDYEYYPVENDYFTVKEDWESYSDDVITSFNDSILFAGFFFRPIYDVDETTVLYYKPHNNYGYFNNIESFADQLSSNLLQEYVHNPAYNTLFNYNRIETVAGSHCYIADSIIYGWIGNTFSDIVVNNARQISSYLYGNEVGEIVYQDRMLHFKKALTQVNGFYELDMDYITITSGNTYRYGSKYYKISFNDLIEVNNIRSGSSFNLVVGKNGITSNFVSPQSLDVSNFRTSDLGVPDEDTLNNELVEGQPEFVILRRPPGFDNNYPNTSLFVIRPEDQAERFSKSLPFPNEIFSIEVDPLMNESLGYNNICIGDYFYIDYDVDYKKVFLIKRISYNPKDIYEKSTSVQMSLMFVGLIANPTNEVYEDDFLFAETLNEAVVTTLNAPANFDAVSNMPQCEVNLSWDAVEHADEYVVDYNADATGWVELVRTESLSAVHDLTVGGLPSTVDTEIVYRVRAETSTVQSSYSQDTVIVDNTSC